MEGDISVGPTGSNLIRISKGLAYITKSTRSRRDNYSMREDWEGDPPTRDRFSPYKGIQIFGYEIEIEKESEKKFKILEKKYYCSPCNFHRKDSSCPVYDRTVVIRDRS